MDGARNLRLAGPLRYLIGMDPVQPRSHRGGAIGVLVGKRRTITSGIPFLAIDHAGLTADADIEVDDEAKLDGRRFRQHRHDASPLPCFVHSMP